MFNQTNLLINAKMCYNLFGNKLRGDIKWIKLLLMEIL